MVHKKNGPYGPLDGREGHWEDPGVGVVGVIKGCSEKQQTQHGETFSSGVEGRGEWIRSGGMYFEGETGRKESVGTTDLERSKETLLAS